MPSQPESPERPAIDHIHANSDPESETEETSSDVEFEFEQTKEMNDVLIERFKKKL